ncbi:MAG: kelch repeat-containing protein, partial [Verrucomicrobiota bacterium]
MKRNNVVLRALNTVLSSWLVLTLLVPVHMLGWVSSANASTSARVTEVQPLNVPRQGHTATVLPGDRVLVIGGENEAGPVAVVESFDLTTGVFTLAGNLVAARVGHKATLLDDGRVLITGGHDAGGALSSAEIYDPATQTSQAIGDMTAARNNHTATKMLGGRVLLAGGDAAGTAELFDPLTVTFTSIGSLQQARAGHSATLFSDNSVFLAGGGANTAEFFDLTNQTFTLVTQPMTAARTDSTAISTTDAKVLMVGGDADNTVEQFDPATETFTVAATLPMTNSSATLLANDKVLVLGSDMAGVLSVDSSNQWETVTTTNAVPLQRTGQTATELPGNKQILIAGGLNNSNELVGAAVLFNPASLATDYDDYPPFSFVNITGSGFLPGESVSNQVVQVEGPDAGAAYDAWAVTTDNNGEFATSWLVFSEELLDTTLELTSKGQTSGLTAQTRFTDAAAVTVATGGSSISADTARVGGTSAFTTLTGPVITETDNTGMPLGSVILTAPAGFEFDTTGNSVTVTISGSGSGGSNADAYINTTNSISGDSNNSMTFTPTASTITVWVTVASSPSRRSVFTFSGIKVRPTDATPLAATGNITISGTSGGITTGTNMGTLTEVPGVLSQLVMNPTTIASATAGTSVSGSFTSITAKDANGNVCNSGPNSFTGTVTFGGTAGATGTSAAFTAGVLSAFPTLTPTVAGSGKTITATSGAVVGTTTITTVNPGVLSATQSTLTPTSASITANGSSTQVLTVQAKDANNNNLTTGG